MALRPGAWRRSPLGGLIQHGPGEGAGACGCWPGWWDAGEEHPSADRCHQMLLLPLLRSISRKGGSDLPFAALRGSFLLLFFSFLSYRMSFAYAQRCTSVWGMRLLEGSQRWNGLPWFSWPGAGRRVVTSASKRGRARSGRWHRPLALRASLQGGGRLRIATGTLLSCACCGEHCLSTPASSEPPGTLREAPKTHPGPNPIAPVPCWWLSPELG